ncbi:MAG: outer membrane lipoprotein-sorting protein, partial [Polyangiaceae bacterium]
PMGALRAFALRTAALLAALLVLAASAGVARGDDLSDLVRRADHALRGGTTAAVLRMDIHTQAYDRSYSMVYWEDARAPGGGDVLVKILGPALFRGFGTLKVGGRLTLYDPSSDRMTVLGNSMLGDSWMGSHFNNDDFVKDTDLARDYTVRQLASSSGNERGHAVVFHDLELRPRPTAPVSWDHILLRLYVDGGDVIPVRQDFFRRAGETAPYRTLTFSDVKPIGGRVAPTVLTMTVADKPGELTRVTYDQARFDVPLPAGKFTEQALRQ